MGYTVGSASVDIVPDFKNAQLAITAFFNKQRDELKIPAKLDFDENAVRNAETQARNMGSRVSKAMNDAASRNQATADKIADQIVEARFKSLARAHAEALRMNAALDREAARAQKAQLDEETRARIQAEREVTRTEKERAKAYQQAHSEALRLNAQIDRDNQARVREQIRLDESAARQAIQTAQRVARERQRIADEEARQRERQFKQDERAFQQQLREQIKALKEAHKTATANEKIRIKVEIDEKQALLSGRRYGGLVTRAMHEELRQNAGLISAVLGGVLLAGAPAAIGAATVLFGGIGAVAAFQNDRLRASWKGLWDEIKSGAQSDAAVLVPAFDRMAGSIGQAFQRSRAEVRNAYGAMVPMIDSFSASITQTAENALPGLVRAVMASGPVVRGLGELLEKTGSGVGAFFDTLSTHSYAAGAAASNLGDVLQQLLPTIAELLGQGAELATIVLPAITSGFSGLNILVGALGGTLPVVLSAWLAFRSAQGIGRLMTGWAQSLDKAAQSGGIFSGVMGKASTGLASVGKAAPLLGVAVGLLGALFAASKQQINDWSRALDEGGKAAREARAEMAEYSSTMDTLNSGFLGFIGNLLPAGAALDMIADDADDAAEAHKRYLESLTPLESAQRDLRIATDELARGMDDESTTASELEGMQRAVGRAAAVQAREEEKLQRATEGVTEAMQAQADAARARVDSHFGYAQAVQDVAEAQQKLQETLADTEASAVDVNKATMDYNQSLLDQVQAAADVATSNLPAAMTDQQKAVIGAKGALDELNKLIEQGITLPPDLETYRQQLIAITNGADEGMLAQAQLSTALGEVGAAVEAIPNSAVIEIHDPSPAIIQRLGELGFTITNLPNGDVRVEAETDEAKDNLGNLSSQLTNINQTTAEPHVNLIDDPFRAKHGASMQALNQLNGQHPSPTASLTDNMSGPTRNLISLSQLLGVQKPRPTVSVNDQASGTLRSIIGNLAGIVSKTVTVTVQNRMTTPGLAEGGSVDDALAGSRAFRNLPRYDGGGSVWGRGGPRDDLNIIRVSPGEHVFDAQDVQLMGGQAGVYAFREMLNSGKLGSPATATSTGVQQMLAVGAPRSAAPQASSTTPRAVSLYTPDIPAAIRALKAVEHQEAALAPVWGT